MYIYLMYVTYLLVSALPTPDRRLVGEKHLGRRMGELLTRCKTLGANLSYIIHIYRLCFPHTYIYARSKALGSNL